jgi:hypothetical protein
MMRKGLITFIVLVLAVAGVAATVASGGPTSRSAKDKNTKIKAADKKAADKLAKQIYRQVSTTQRGMPSGNLCAIAVIPGPATSSNIRFGVFNTTSLGGAGVVGNTLDHLIVDSFSALGGSSLLHESVFLPAAPPGGTLAVEYPNGVSGKGPAVLSFTGFDSLESVAFNTDPDTYDDPDFGATVSDMDGTRLEAVFSAGLRCAGTLTFNAGFNASIAALTQTSP